MRLIFCQLLHLLLFSPILKAVLTFIEIVKLFSTVFPSVLCNSIFVHAPSVGIVFSWIISWVLVVKVSLALILAESQGFQRSFVLIYLL